MGLYRQIAGNGGAGLSGYNHPNQVGFLTPLQTINPSQPITTDSGTGWVNPLFSDPRAFDPNTIDLDTFPTPIPLPEGVNPLPPIRPSQPLTPTTEVLPTDTKTAITNNILPLVALAGVLLVAIKGDDLLHNKRKIVLMGGLGLLYYGMAKNKLV